MRTFIVTLIAAAVAAKELRFKGWSPKGKLDRCEGDCDSSKDCKKGLVCGQRSHDEAIQGCRNNSVAPHDADFCFDPEIFTLNFKGWSPKGTLSRCEGDCDHHKDCAKGLVCQQRSKGEKVPGCSGKSKVDHAADFCIEPQEPKLNFKGWKPKGILGECEGDCDHHKDCATGLICQERSKGEDVPGCRGESKSHKAADYCVKGERDPPLVFKGWKPKGKLGMCEGDCDHHGDCGKGLMCQERSKGGDVPGCSGEDKHHKAADFCVKGHKDKPLVFKGWKPKGKLEMCEGDCDHNHDCAKGLKCVQRSRGGKVAGCSGHAKMDKGKKGHLAGKLIDYCV